MIKNSRTGHIARNTLSGLAYRVTCIVLPFIVRTILIKKLGDEYAGLNSLFSAILQVLSLSELGFATAVCYAMYKPVAEGDNPKICALLNLIKKVYRVVGVVILIIGLCLMPFLPHLISGSYPADINLYVLYLIYLFNTVVSYFLFAYTGTLLNAHQRTDIENIINLVANVVMYGLQIAILLVFPNYYVYIIILPLCTIAINLLKYWRVRRLFPEYHAAGKVDKAEQKTIYINIGALIGHKLSGIVVQPISNIVISAILGLTLLTIYSNYYYIISALLVIVNVVYAALTPTIGNSLVTEGIEKNYRDFKALTFANVWFIGWMSICLVCLFQPFMLLWLGADYLLPISSVVLFGLYFYLWRFKDILSTYKDAAGMWKADALKPYVVTIATGVLNVLLVKWLGINGSIIAGIVGVFVISMPWEVQVFYRRYFCKNAAWYYLRMLIYSVVVLAVGVLTYFVCALLPNTGFWYFVAKLGICAVLPNIAFLLCGFMTPECRFIFRKIFRRQAAVPPSVTTVSD